MGRRRLIFACAKLATVRIYWRCRSRVRARYPVTAFLRRSPGRVCRLKCKKSDGENGHRLIARLPPSQSACCNSHDKSMRLAMACGYRVIDIACIMLYLSLELSNAAPGSSQPHRCRQLQGVCRAASA